MEDTHRRVCTPPGRFHLLVRSDGNKKNRKKKKKITIERSRRSDAKLLQSRVSANTPKRELEYKPPLGGWRGLLGRFLLAIYRPRPTRLFSTPKKRKKKKMDVDFGPISFLSPERHTIQRWRHGFLLISFVVVVIVVSVVISPFSSMSRHRMVGSIGSLSKEHQHKQTL